MKFNLLNLEINKKLIELKSSSAMCTKNQEIKIKLIIASTPFQNFFKKFQPIF